eukprot:SAG11_NODE_743_length_7407_cov_2.941434_4_plen_98_part_00
MIKDSEFEAWMHSPTPVGQTVQCRMKRDKETGFFDLYLDDDQHFKFVMSAQKKAKSKSGECVYACVLRACCVRACVYRLSLPRPESPPRVGSSLEWE